MTDTFTWATPPQFISPPGVSTAADKDCLIVLTDGQKLLGKLLRFSPEDSVLEYQPNRDTAVTSLPFVSIKNLRLVQPLALKKQAGTMNSRAMKYFPLPKSKPARWSFRTAVCPSFCFKKVEV